MAENWIGTRVASRYEVLGLLGQGGMATVYQARDMKLGRIVVLKAPLPHLLADPDFAQRFRNEIQAMVRLAHPGIVQVIDIDAQADVPFAVLQYLSGGSLRQRMKTSQGADPKYWLNTIADALDYIHARKYIHRDVKPDNILFDDANRAVLGDFGVVKVLADRHAGRSAAGLTTADVALGTPPYMPSESVHGRPCDARSDQFSLAVTVYEVLAGIQPPTLSAQVMNALPKSVVRPLREVANHVSQSLSDAVMRAMDDDPKRRFESCAAFARACEDPERQSLSHRLSAKAARGMGRHAPTVLETPDAGRGYQPTKHESGSGGSRTPLTCVVVLLLVLLALLGAGVFLWSKLEEDNKADTRPQPRKVGMGPSRYND